MHAVPERAPNLNQLWNSHGQEDAGTHQRKMPHDPKTEKLPQDQRRGANHDKSNHIPTGWTNPKTENNNTKEVPPVL